MEKDRKKRIGLAAIMLTALLSCFTIGGTMAKYFSQMKGTDNVTVAKFDVTASFVVDETVQALAPEQRSIVYTVNITSQSEVDVVYDIVVTFGDAEDAQKLPNGVIIELDHRTPEKQRTIAVNGFDHTYVFYNVGTLNSSTRTAEHEISFYVADDAISENITEVLSCTGRIGVQAEQVIPNQEE